MGNKTETKVVYAYTIDGRLIGKKILDYTDRSPISDAWQLPAQTTETKPPTSKENYDLYFKKGTWQYVEQTKDAEKLADEKSA